MTDRGDNERCWGNDALIAAATSSYSSSCSLKSANDATICSAWINLSNTDLDDVLSSLYPLVVVIAVVVATVIGLGLLLSLLLLLMKPSPPTLLFNSGNHPPPP